MNIVLQSFKHYELTSLHPFIFAFIVHSIGTILSKKCSEKWGVGKKDAKRGWSDRGEEAGLKSSAQYGSAGRVLWSRVCSVLPSVRLSRFSWNWIISFFFSFGMVLETHMKLRRANLSWFFATWHKFRKDKNCFNNYGQKWLSRFSS